MNAMLPKPKLPGSILFRRLLAASPERVPVIGFLFLIGAGTLLLCLPFSAAGARLHLLDALFTATSACCVTGLTVVDTGSYFSGWGQGTILLLIQIGGIGYMTLSTMAIMMLGRRPSLATRLALQDNFTHSGQFSPATIVRHVVVFTLVIEAAGAALLFLRFLPRFGAGRALWLAGFHAVSAFCNAGFGLFSDSLSRFQDDWLVNATIMTLIVLGGLGFLVLAELRIRFPLNRRGWSRLSLHTRLVLTVSCGLIVAGTVVLLGFEWQNTMAPLSLHGRLLAAAFHAISARTAGFNSLPVGAMANETLFFLILLMFIGASPGSCGGGIKTTTFATLFALGSTRLRGRDRPAIFKRSIPALSLNRAVALALLSIVVVSTALFMLLITELGDASHLQSRGSFLELMFETVSAFGTVGLSTGLTPSLSPWGKLILTVVMFIGRLGPLVVALAFSRRDTAQFHYAEENIMIG
jgi:trk system potassium uptake protein TrkH